MITTIRRRDAVETKGWPDSVHPVLRRVYAGRGVAAHADIDYRLVTLAEPARLGGITRACEMLAEAIHSDQCIVVVGDFDADGATGTAVAVRGLRLLGARNVHYRVPHRQVHGYGLSVALVETLTDPRPDLIVTVDNGIASHAGIDAAKARGIAVLVTDHHLPGASLPAADAIVNPNSPGDTFASKALAGVGVMFCLLIALRSHLRELNWFDKRSVAEPDLRCLLDLVALGTVADLVPLDRNNRVLVAAGLRRIRNGDACAGINALLVVGGRDPARIGASDLGFIVAPRINAAGRLEDMAVGIECLLADDASLARALAEQLSAINAERRHVQAAMTEQADALVARWIATQGQATLPFGLCLFDPEWHPGVVGLVASRLKDRLHRPVIACAPAGEGSDEVRASARSIGGFHVRDALAEVDARHPGLIARFGGHAMAAGMTLRHADLPAFATAFDAVTREHLDEAQLHAVLLSDGELDGADFTFELARALRDGGPWGQGFAEPLFDNEFDLVSWRIVGERHWRMQLRLAGAAEVIESILFNAPDGEQPPTRLRALYQLDIDEWNGRERVRLLIRHIESA
ncbi:MAG: single-stranded-DNA-specific exonuclease RecJ [Dokdonella sp.]